MQKPAFGRNDAATLAKQPHGVVHRQLPLWWHSLGSAGIHLQGLPRVLRGTCSQGLLHGFIFSAVACRWPAEQACAQISPRLPTTCSWGKGGRQALGNLILSVSAG